jgi:hypothetical protein
MKSLLTNAAKKYFGNNGFLIEIVEGKEVKDKVSKRRGISL